MRAKVIAILSVLVVLLSAGPVASDGCFFWRLGADLREPEQLAVLHHDGETETLILRAKYEGEAYDFAWVVPVPSVPEVEAVQAAEPSPGTPSSLFDELGRYTHARESSRAAIGRQPLGEESEVTASAGVDVVDRKRVGIFDMTVLRADDTEALAEWLDLRRFRLSEKRREVLRHYVRKDWYFVACRIARYDLTDQVESDMRSGTLQPIKLTFESESAVYPLRMSALNTGETDVLIYVLGETPMVPTEGGHSVGFSMEHSTCGFGQLGTGLVDPDYGTYARVESSDVPMTWEAVRPAEGSAYLCKYRATLQSSELADDITFRTLDPIEYWEGVRDTASSADARAMAGWVLAWHDPGILMDYVGSADTALKSAAAYSSKASAGVLERLASDSEEGVRWMVAANTATPTELLMALATDESVLVREAVAGNASASEDVLALLAADRQRSVRELVSRHPSAGERIWNIWAGSEAYVTRIEAASYDDAPAAILELLSGDENVEVRKRIARRSDVSTELRMKIAHDPDPVVRRALVRSCEKEEGHILAFLAGDSHESVREAVAFYWLTPDETLIMLADDPSPKVRSKVARNRVTPKSTIIRLTEDPEELVRRRAFHGLLIRGFTRAEAAEMTGLPEDTRK
jgi:hypothetical protein